MHKQSVKLASNRSAENTQLNVHRPKHRQAVIQASQAQAARYIVAQAQATCNIRRQSTDNQYYTQAEHRQRITQTIHPSTGNQFCSQRKHRLPVIQAAQAQATSNASIPGSDNEQLILEEREAHAHTNEAKPPIRRAIQTSTVIHAAQLYRQRDHTQTFSIICCNSVQVERVIG